jgi:hypothetical protein
MAATGGNPAVPLARSLAKLAQWIPTEHRQVRIWGMRKESQIQALDPTQPGLPLKKGRAGTMTHDYNGTEPPRYSPRSTCSKVR